MMREGKGNHHQMSEMLRMEPKKQFPDHQDNERILHFSNQSQFEQFFGFQPRKGMETYQHPKDRVQRNQEPICPEELFGRFFGRVDGKRGGEKG